MCFTFNHNVQQVVLQGITYIKARRNWYVASNCIWITDFSCNSYALNDQSSVGSHEENCSGFDKSSELTDLGRKLTKTINQIDLIN